MDPLVQDMLNRNPWMDVLMAQCLSKATPEEIQSIIDDKPAPAMGGSIIGISVVKEEEKCKPDINDEGKSIEANHYKTDSLSDSLSDRPIYQSSYHPTDRAIRLSDALSPELIEVRATDSLAITCERLSLGLSVVSRRLSYHLTCT